MDGIGKRQRKALNAILYGNEGTNMDEQKPVTVTLSREAYDEVKKVADKSKRTVAQVLGEAIAVEKLYSEVRESGGRLLVERRGKLHEIEESSK